MPYAIDTDVPVDRTRAQIEAMRTQIPRYLTLRKEAQARAAQYQSDLDD